jgi:hypothetical protein
VWGVEQVEAHRAVRVAHIRESRTSCCRCCGVDASVCGVAPVAGITVVRARHRGINWNKVLPAATVNHHFTCVDDRAIRKRWRARWCVRVSACKTDTLPHTNRHTGTQAHARTHSHTRTHENTHTHAQHTYNKRTPTQTHAHTHAHTHTRTHTHAHARIHALNAHENPHRHTHTHTHTHTKIRMGACTPQRCEQSRSTVLSQQEGGRVNKWCVGGGGGGMSTHQG